MPMNAPKKSTFYICLILAILGLIFWLVALLGLVPGFTFVFDLIGFLLVFFAWLLLSVATRVKGL
jgi:hypothetical protein